MTRQEYLDLRSKNMRLQNRLNEMCEEAWEAGVSTSEMFPHYQNMLDISGTQMRALMDYEEAN